MEAVNEHPRRLRALSGQWRPHDTYTSDVRFAAAAAARLRHCIAAVMRCSAARAVRACASGVGQPACACRNTQRNDGRSLRSDAPSYGRAASKACAPHRARGGVNFLTKDRRPDLRLDPGFEEYIPDASWQRQEVFRQLSKYKIPLTAPKNAHEVLASLGEWHAMNQRSSELPPFPIRWPASAPHMCRA